MVNRCNSLAAAQFDGIVKKAIKSLKHQVEHIPVGGGAETLKKYLVGMRAGLDTLICFLDPLDEKHRKM